MFLSHAVLTNKPGVQSIFAGGSLPVPSSPPSDPCRRLSARGYPPRHMTIPPTQYSPTSPAYSPTSPAVRCQRQDIPFRPRPPTTRAAIEHRYRPQPGLPSITRLPTAVFAYKSRLLAYELRRRWASLILAEQLRGGLDAVQRRRRPDACRSLFAVASGIRAIRSSA